MSSSLVEKSQVGAFIPPQKFTIGQAVRDSHVGVALTVIALWGSFYVLALCVLIFIVNTIHWPLAGDAALMHYVGFLMDHGQIPYRDIADINLPGSYLIDYAVMHTLGGGSLAWRLFDLSLMVCGILAMVSIARPYGRFAGLFAGSILTLVHGRDGIYELGQRDLVIAILLLLAYAALFCATRSDSPRWMLAFGLCAGLTATIKPTFIPFGILLLLTLTLVRRNEGRSIYAFVAWGVTGLILPGMAALVFLWRMHAIHAFVGAIQGIIWYHATAGRKPLSFLLLHSFSPLMPMLLIWICCLFSRVKDWERTALLFGVLVGLFSYVVQGKGFSYQRYPFVALLLLVMSIDFVRCVRTHRWVRIAGWAGIAFGTLFLAPVSVVEASRFNWSDNEFSSMLQSDLRQLGDHSLNRQVQCIDTIDGCFDVLYRMELVQSDGFVYDEFLFGPNRNGIVAENRAKLWAAMQTKPPKLLIVTDDLFPSGPGNFQKIEQWPQFADYLQQRYSLCVQRTPPHMVRWWSRTERPHSYRIYCMNPIG